MWREWSVRHVPQLFGEPQPSVEGHTQCLEEYKAQDTQLLEDVTDKKQKNLLQWLCNASSMWRNKFLPQRHATKEVFLKRWNIFF